MVIKKYPNRRLYDTSSGRYVNLDDLAALIRQGADVQVVDAKTGRGPDARSPHPDHRGRREGQPTGLPLELLRQLILTSDRAGQEFIMWYLKSAFDAYGKGAGSRQTRLQRCANGRPLAGEHDEEPAHRPGALAAAGRDRTGAAAPPRRGLGSRLEEAPGAPEARKTTSPGGHRLWTR